MVDLCSGLVEVSEALAWQVEAPLAGVVVEVAVAVAVAVVADEEDVHVSLEMCLH